MKITKDEAKDILNDIDSAYSEGQSKVSKSLIRKLIKFVSEIEIKVEYSYLLSDESKKEVM